MTTTIPTPDRGTLTDTDEVADYVAEVHSYLTDLDAEEIEDVIDDLFAHLTEVRQNSELPLTALVGEPHAYVIELRASAGLGPITTGAQTRASGPPPPLRPPLTKAVGRTVRKASEPVRRHAWFQQVRSFLPELRPAWWVARGFLLAVMASMLTSNRDNGLGHIALIPDIYRSDLLGLLATIGLIVASVRWGRAQYEGGWRPWAVRLAGGVAVLALLIAWSQVNDRGTYYAEDIAASTQTDFTILPANIFAYLPDGTPIDSFLLYNESGEPVVLPQHGYSEWLHSQFEAPFQTAASGAPTPNLYPRTMSVWQYSGASDSGATLEPTQPPLVLAPAPAPETPVRPDPPDPLTPTDPVVPNEANEPSG